MSKADDVMVYLKDQLAGKQKVRGPELRRILGSRTASPYWIDQYIRMAVDRGIIKSCGQFLYEVCK